MPTDDLNEAGNLLTSQKESHPSKQSTPIQPTIPDYLKRLNAKPMNDRVGQCFIMNVKKRPEGFTPLPK